MTSTSIQTITRNNCISSLRQYWKYCNKHGYNPWKYYKDIKYWCHYLLVRVEANSFSIAKTDRRGITYIFVDIFKYDTPFEGYYYTLFMKKLKKIFGKTKKNRLPILLHHHIKFAKYLNIDRYNAYTVDFDELLTLVIVQLYGFAGRRCGELLNKDKKAPTMLLDNVKFHTEIEKDGKLVPCNYVTIIHNHYKNKIHKSDYMFSIIGETSDRYIDPYYFFKTYLLRRAQLKLQYTTKSPLFVWSNGKQLTYRDLLNKITPRIANNVVDSISRKFITPYSLRIGLNTMLEARSLSSAQIKDYVGWIRDRKQSSQIQYTVLPTWWKTQIITQIIEQEPNISGWKRWGKNIKTN